MEFSISAAYRVEGLTEIGELPTAATAYSISFQEGEQFVGITNEEVFDQEERAYLLRIFSDENLSGTHAEVTEFIQPYEAVPNGIEFSFMDEDLVSYAFRFDEHTVFVTITGESGIRQGYFSFKNEGTYLELCRFIDENLEEQTIKREESIQASMKNVVEVWNYETLYSATFPYSLQESGVYDFFEIGVCSFNREGDSRPVVSGYARMFSQENSDTKLIILSDILNDNTITMGNRRMVKVQDNTGVGTEYDYIPGYNWSHNFQINVSEHGQADCIVINSIHAMTSTKRQTYVEMSACEQTGQLPLDFFSQENNSILSNKVDDFSKLYCESIDAKHPYLQNAEWGICSYLSERSGNVHGFYFYSPELEVYFISEIEGNLLLMESGDISSKHHNIITFEANRVLQNGYELMDSSFHFPIRFHLGISAEKAIIYRGLFDEGDGCNYVINSYRYLSGDLSSLTFNPIEKTTDENKKNVESVEQQDTQKPAEKDETENIMQEEPVKKPDETETEEQPVGDFIDVPKEHWAYNEVREFAEKKIVLGYGNGYFGADDPITYEHFSLLLYRLFGYRAENTEQRPAIREDVIVSVVKALKMDVINSDVSMIERKFFDCESLQEESLPYIAAAIEAGLIIGADGKLFPEENLTRAETVTLLSRAVKYSVR